MMITSSYEIIYLKKRGLDLDYLFLDEAEVFINYFANRILELAANKEGKYSEISTKKAKLFKKVLCSPQILRQMPQLKYILKQAGYKY